MAQQNPQDNHFEQDIVRMFIEEELTRKLAGMSSEVFRSAADLASWLDHAFEAVLPMLPDEDRTDKQHGDDGGLSAAYGAVHMHKLIHFFREQTPHTAQGREGVGLCIAACHEVLADYFGNAPEPKEGPAHGASSFGLQAPPATRVQKRKSLPASISPPADDAPAAKPAKAGAKTERVAPRELVKA